VGTCLAAADADGRDRPTRAEAVDLVVHGLAERVRVVLPSEAALRPAALPAVGLGATLSLSALVLEELLPPVREHQVTSPRWRAVSVRPRRARGPRDDRAHRGRLARGLGARAGEPASRR
jgi:hypothetical protein